MKKNATEPSGALIINKPADITSHDVVATLRKTLQTKAVGHAGTLDPFATGVLIILLGKANRLMEYIHTLPKRYTAEITLGSVSNTQDLTGIITSSRSTYEPNLEDIEKVLETFTGTITQTPPIYSAVKFEGKKLYEYARQDALEKAKKAAGERRREVSIYSIKINAYAYPMLKITVSCSTGTYIRTLAHDIGISLKNIGAYVSNLERNAIGEFTVENAVNPKLSSTELLSALIPIERLVNHLPRIDLDNESVAKLQQGKAIPVDRIYPQGASVAIFSLSGELVGIGLYNSSTSLLSPKKVLSLKSF